MVSCPISSVMLFVVLKVLVFPTGERRGDEWFVFGQYVGWIYWLWGLMMSASITDQQIGFRREPQHGSNSLDLHLLMSAKPLIEMIWT